jgi:CheY-like chemotaxis protein
MMIEFVSNLELGGAAQDDADAIRMFQGHQPDVALMGLQLSGLDGIAATQFMDY